MPTATTEKIDCLYALRDGDARSVRESILLIERRLSVEQSPDVNTYELLWRLSRARFFLGQCAESERRIARAHHRAGAAAGKQAARIAPNRVEGHFWQGVNLALRAQAEPAWRALPLALIARNALRRALAIAHTYHDAGALRVLARLESKLPRPFGNSQHAAQLFTRAVEIAPTNTVTRRYFAEFLLSAGATTAAREHLRAIRDAPLDPVWKYEITRDKNYAQEKLSKG